MFITWVRFFRAWRNHAVVSNFVVKSEWEGRRIVFVDWHGRVVGEVGLVHHLEHVVTADLSSFWPQQTKKTQISC
jgi:hypothetical protein